MTTVFTNGCFDLFHAGHLHSLREASKLGYLHVGINSDSSILKLKGNSRPIIPEDQRIEILESISCVGTVHLFHELTPIKLIKEIKPDIIFKGGDWEQGNIVGCDLAETISSPRVKGISTSEIIDKIRAVLCQTI